MVGVAWWSCALAALGALAPAPASARVLESCELARELRRLGVRAEHVSVWVCIAYHESRFDTAALNPGSGDHGLLQISELYWCGAGKACGLPCAALRDDDIADDVACALRVHEEHTRLQGDGFLAWVVYPQHCKQNTKKYLADCSVSLKDANTTKPIEKSRSIDTVGYKMNSTFELNPIIDELKPPYFSTTSNFGNRVNELETSDRGKVEQFKWQHVHFPNIDDLSLPVFNQKMEKIPESPPSSTSTTLKPREETKRTEVKQIIFKFTTAKPILTASTNFKYDSITNKTTLRPPSSGSYAHFPRTITVTPATLKITSTTSKRKSTTAINRYSFTTTARTPSTTTTRLHRTPYSENLKTFSYTKVTTARTPLSKEVMKKQFRCLGCRAPSTVENPLSSKTKSNNYNYNNNNSNSTTTTLKPKTTSNFQKYRMAAADSSVPTTTRTPSTTSTSASALWRTVSSRAPAAAAVTDAPDTADAPANSIFDLYLNTKRPKLTTFNFSPRSDSWYKRRIFFDGTTSPATPWRQKHDLNKSKDEIDGVRKHSRTS